jgi:hypothetical protein
MASCKRLLLKNGRGQKMGIDAFPSKVCKGSIDL